LPAEVGPRRSGQIAMIAAAIKLEMAFSPKKLKQKPVSNRFY
jgi:hypothetical protein